MPKLPPRVVEVDFENFLGFVLMEGVDFTFAGDFFACHLAIEHYLDEFLKSCAPDFVGKAGS